MKADGKYTIHMITFYGYVFMYSEITTFFPKLTEKMNICHFGSKT